MKTAVQKLRTYLELHRKTAFLFMGIISLVLTYALFLLLQNATKQTGSNTPQPTAAVVQIQQPFTVLSSNIISGKTVDPEETILTFTTDKPVMSEKNITVSLKPTAPYYWEFVNTFPTKNLAIQIYGGLALKTNYTVTVADNKGTVLSTYTFKTSDKTPESSSGLVRREEEKTIQSFYPLFEYIPLSTADFTLDYTGRLSLLVTIKRGSRADIEKTVTEWIKSKGVDPESHTVLYRNAP